MAEFLFFMIPILFTRDKWVIPEDICTIPQVESWNFEGGGLWTGIQRQEEVFMLGILEAWGIFQFWISRGKRTTVKNSSCHIV